MNGKAHTRLQRNVLHHNRSRIACQRDRDHARRRDSWIGHNHIHLSILKHTGSCKRLLQYSTPCFIRCTTVGIRTLVSPISSRATSIRHTSIAGRCILVISISLRALPVGSSSTLRASQDVPLAAPEARSLALALAAPLAVCKRIFAVCPARRCLLCITGVAALAELVSQVVTPGSVPASSASPLPPA